jgi:hypothetical protein
MPQNIRRVVSGLDEHGKSVWTSDLEPSSRLDIPATGVRVTDIWRIPQIPPDVLVDHAPRSVEMWPTPGGLVFRLAEIPPLSTIKSGDGRAAMHRSDTVDLMVIISGEIWGYQSDAHEGVLLRPGDTFIQRGTMHAWENRGEVPCLFAVVLVGARTPG